MLDVGLRRRRNMSRDESLRIVEQHADGFARLFVPQNLSAERILRVFCYTSDLQRRAVRDRAVPIGTRKKDRIVW